MSINQPEPHVPTTADVEQAVQAVVRRVQTWAEQFPRSKSAIAVAAGLAPNTLARFESASWTPSLHTLRRLEQLIDGRWAPVKSSPGNRNRV